jgi:hypothetical protein
VRREAAQALAVASAGRGAAAGASGWSLRRPAGRRASGAHWMQSRSAADVRSVRSVHTSSYFARRRSCFLRPRQLPCQAPRLCEGALGRNGARHRGARDMSIGAGHADACASRSILSKALERPHGASLRRMEGGPARRVDSTAALPPSLNSTLATRSALSLPGYMPLVMFSCASSSATLPAPACTARPARVCL